MDSIISFNPADKISAAVPVAGAKPIMESAALSPDLLSVQPDCMPKLIYRKDSVNVSSFTREGPTNPTNPALSIPSDSIPSPVYSPFDTYTQFEERQKYFNLSSLSLAELEERQEYFDLLSSSSAQFEKTQEYFHLSSSSFDKMKSQSSSEKGFFSRLIGRKSKGPKVESTHTEEHEEQDKKVEDKREDVPKEVHEEVHGEQTEGEQENEGTHTDEQEEHDNEVEEKHEEVPEEVHGEEYKGEHKGEADKIEEVREEVHEEAQGGEQNKGHDKEQNEEPEDKHGKKRSNQPVEGDEEEPKRNNLKKKILGFFKRLFSNATEPSLKAWKGGREAIGKKYGKDKNGNPNAAGLGVSTQKLPRKLPPRPQNPTNAASSAPAVLTPAAAAAMPAPASNEARRLVEGYGWVDPAPPAPTPGPHPLRPTPPNDEYRSNRNVVVIDGEVFRVGE